MQFCHSAQCVQISKRSTSFVAGRLMLAIIFIAVFASLVSPPVRAEGCLRHAYNKSTLGFQITLQLPNAKLESNRLQVIRVEAGETKEIVYDGSPGFGQADTDTLGTTQGNYERRASFKVEGCYLRHDGAVTDPFVLNEPADGDIILCKDLSCQ